jgi:predicted MFS family arabinose efflux permease
MFVKKPRNPWLIVLGSGLALMVGSGSIALFTFGIFLKPIIGEFGWHRGSAASAVTISHILTAASTPLVGKLVDRWGARRVTLPFIVGFAVSTAAISLTTVHLWSFILLYALCGMAASGQGPLPYAKAITASFGARRGLALGIAMAGVGLGTAVVPQIARLLIQLVGWRGAYVGLGILTFAVAFPSVALFLSDPHDFVVNQMPLVDDYRAPRKEDGVTLWQALTESPRFWLIGAAVLFAAAAINGTLAHIVPLLTDRGTSIQVATTFLSISGLSLILGRCITGFLLDRLFAPYVASFFFGLPILGTLALDAGSGKFLSLAAVVTLGLGLGAEIDILAFLVGRYFGLRSFGEIYGYLMGLFLFGSGVGPWLMGMGFDATHSYNAGLLSCSFALSTASLCVLFLGPYVYVSEPIPVSANIPHPQRTY